MEKDIFSMDKDTTICFCNDVSLGEILQAIQNGACTLDDIMDATDAGTACGLCKSPEDDPDGEREVHLTEILQQAKEKGICPE
ncbi:(2Fe-2S)-binding protein [Persephonella sp.]|uniref:(2Fe-2S)-binding protein n=1 Tax=Persephonella sp. TaxID=2060922 RepID=UPI002628A390|nr:(2Fe-2S)-binding protein [Persephonella sp.]